MERSRRQRLVSCLALATVSWSVAFAHVARASWFGARDLLSFAVWSLLAAALAYPILGLMHRRAARVCGVSLLGIAALAGLSFGFGWTLVVALFLEGSIGAFGFSALLCWMTGSVVGFLASTALVRRSLWPGAVGLALALPLTAAVVLQGLSTAPPDAVVYFEPDTTQEQLTYVWTEVLSTSTGRGFWPLDGIEGLSVDGDGARRGIRVSFRARTRGERRTEILARARVIPFVEEIVDTPRSEAP